MNENNIEPTGKNVKYAGYYHDDIAYNPDTDKMDLRKIKIICPGCQREFAALLSKHTEKIRLIMIGCDYDVPVVEMKSYCIQCKTAFTFKLDCS